MVNILNMLDLLFKVRNSIYMRKRKSIWKYLFFVFLFSTVTIFELEYIKYKSENNNKKEISDETEKFKDFLKSEEMIKNILNDNRKNDEITCIYRNILSDLKYFPIPLEKEEKENITYINSWDYERTYGGKRRHEGTDLMTSNNVRGYFPVISITDGVVEKKGWLEQGGYRIGIRSESGAYFYYAHLYSYAEGIEPGKKVIAGELLGFVGDTGYSKTEGTTGNFDVHLHMGVYYDYKGKETALNPYYMLLFLESKRLKFNF